MGDGDWVVAAAETAVRLRPQPVYNLEPKVLVGCIFPVLMAGYPS
jgi:hypothetical protein